MKNSFILFCILAVVCIFEPVFGRVGRHPGAVVVRRSDKSEGQHTRGALVTNNEEDLKEEHNKPETSAENTAGQATDQPTEGAEPTTAKSGQPPAKGGQPKLTQDPKSPNEVTLASASSEMSRLRLFLKRAGWFLFNVFVPHLPLSLLHFSVVLAYSTTGTLYDAALSCAVLYVASVANGFVYNVFWEKWMPRAFRAYGNGAKLGSWYFSLLDLRQLVLFEYETSEYLNVSYWTLPMLIGNVASWYIVTIFPMWIRLPCSLAYATFMSGLFISKLVGGRKDPEDATKRIHLVDDIFSLIVGRENILDKPLRGQYFSNVCVRNGYGARLNVFFGDFHAFLRRELPKDAATGKRDYGSTDFMVTAYNIVWPWIYPLQLVCNFRGERTLFKKTYMDYKFKMDMSFVRTLVGFLFALSKKKRQAPKEIGDGSENKGPEAADKK